MPITRRQRERRRKTLGSSDSPPVLHVDPWRSSYDVWLEKTADLEDSPSTDAIEIGNDFEEPLLRWAADQLGLDVQFNVSVVSADDSIFAANLDAMARRGRVGLEAKTTSMPDEYGVEGTDQVPNRVIVQCQHQCFVAGLEVVWVPVLMARFDRLQRRLYKVERNERLIDAIRSGGLEFWNDHVVPSVPPTDTIPSPDLLKRIRRIRSTSQIDPSLAKGLQEALEERCTAEKAVGLAKVKLIASLGSSDAGDYGDPDYIYTYLAQTRTSVNSKKLKIAQPDVWRDFTQSTKFRVLRKVKRR